MTTFDDLAGRFEQSATRALNRHLEELHALPSPDRPAPLADGTLRSAPPAMTQTNRVLALLYRRGDVGVTPMDFHHPTVDGGDVIMRLAPRVLELRNQGFVIDTDKTGGFATYRLRPGVLFGGDAA